MIQRHIGQFCAMSFVNLFDIEPILPESTVVGLYPRLKLALGDNKQIKNWSFVIYIG
jgi:hypothetical protein